MTGRLDIAELRRTYSLPDIAGAVVALKREGGELKGCCPFHQERSPSFTIFAGGERFHCFGCGASGDVLDFVRRSQGIGLREAAAILAGGNLPTIAATPLPAVSDQPDRTEDARAIWRAAQPPAGTPVETYLRSRGLHLPIPASIRFARLRYGKRGREHPVLVAAVASVDDRLTGIHRIYLAPDGTGKAAVSKAKLSLGRVIGGAIRLAPGATSMIVTEGLEDGLTLQQELGRAVWVACGTTMLPAMQFPAGVRGINVGGDADAAGRHGAHAAVEAYTAQRIRARAFFPTTDKDFNDELMARIGS